MGIAELDLNLFHESLYTIRIRRLAQQDENLRKAIFGRDTKVCPELYHYYPHRMFLEALPENAQDQELVFSMLSPHMLIPLIRYNSTDRGGIIPYNKMKDILINFKKSELIPDLKLPLVWVGGRVERFLEAKGKRIYPEEIKQGLYEDFEVASLTTGYFKLNKEKQNLEIQLKKDVTITAEMENRFKKALLKYADVDLPVIIYPYRDFPYAMELDYERKFQNI
jgi:phenylacetate-CoA ligase